MLTTTEDTQLTFVRKFVLHHITIRVDGIRPNYHAIFLNLFSLASNNIA